MTLQYNQSQMGVIKQSLYYFEMIKCQQSYGFCMALYWISVKFRMTDDFIKGDICDTRNTVICIKF